MGQKVHPIGIRLGVVKRHNANWYASPKNYADYLLKDLEVRKFLLDKLNGKSSKDVKSKDSKDKRKRFFFM